MKGLKGHVKGLKEEFNEVLLSSKKVERFSEFKNVKFFQSKNTDVKSRE